MTKVPRFALYGTDEASPAWAEMVNLERIPERSGAHNWEIQPHVHEGLLQVLYIVTGSAGGEALIDGRRWPIVPPCLIVVPSGAVHGFHFRNDIDGPVITAPQRPLESLATAIAPQLLAHVRAPRVLPVDPESPWTQALMPLFDALEREARYPAAGQVAASMSLLAALFVQVARIGESAAAAPSDPRSRKAAQIEQFRQLVNEQFRQQRSVDHYARQMGLTAGHLGRLCRDALGLSPLDVINARLVHEAERELVYSTLSIKQVAAELGFDDEAYFGRFFKKHTARRPTEFREMARAHLAGH
ncbi:helix-turn-helix domain-containing protein [Ramlibacter sp. MAHUQ-53]|uniref:helix-turn-helix domain-containing protein n=1 Tax=unclassified Ramlibacter TaxID=2617605 RepID=UPI0036442A28